MEKINHGRLAFIIMAHKHPAQLERLLRRMAHPQIDCYIHLDAKTDIAPFRHLSGLPGVYFIQKRTAVNWGGFSIVRAEVDSLEEILRTGIPYTYLHLLSSQDYPLVSADQIHRHFLHCGDAEYLDMWREEDVPPMLVRLRRYHFDDWRIPGKYRLAIWASALLPARKTPGNMKDYMASMWWSITRECAHWFVAEVRNKPEYYRFYRHTWGADEFIFATILMHSRFREKIAYNNLRHIDWSEAKASPKTFTGADFDAIMQSGKLFARKFDENTAPGLLNRIDEAIDAPRMAANG